MVWAPGHGGARGGQGAEDLSTDASGGGGSLRDARAWLAREGWRLSSAPLRRPHPNPTFGNPPFQEASLRVLITRLSPFPHVERSSPHLFLADAVRRALPDAYVDMAFFPPAGDRRLLREAGVPLWVGVESCRGVTEFDVALVSTAYVGELVNLPTLILWSGLPLSACQREAPLVILGGSNALGSMVVCSGESMVDAVHFGEGERVVGHLVKGLAARRTQEKGERLAWCREAGLWLPGGEPVSACTLLDPDAEDFPVSFPALNGCEADTARLQISYGCPAFCSFCFEGWDRKPFREVSPEVLARVARRLKARGFTKVELMSFSANAHSRLPTLLVELHRLFDEVNITSQRIDFLAQDPGLIDLEVVGGKRSFSFGIEGVSQRLRDYLHKSLTQDQLEVVWAHLFRHRLRELKVCFVLTGREGEPDFQELRALLASLRTWRARAPSPVRVIASVSPLVRMPGTPLQYEPAFLDLDRFRALSRRMEASCEEFGVECRFAMPWHEYVVGQLLALGDERLAPALGEAARRGWCFDQTVPAGLFHLMVREARRSGLWDELVRGGMRPLAYQRAVRRRVREEFLVARYEQALAGLDTGVCGGRCLGCGACVRPPRPPREDSLGAVQALRALVARKREASTVHLKVWVDESWAGLDHRWVGARVVERLCAVEPEAVHAVWAAREVVFSVGAHAGEFPGLWGETVYAVRTHDPDVVREAVRRAAEAGQEGIRILQVMEGWAPTWVRSLHVILKVPLAVVPRAEELFQGWLRHLRVPFTLRRSSGGKVVEVPPSSKKKGLLTGAVLSTQDGWFVAQIVAGPKLAPRDFVDFCRVPMLHHAVRVGVSRLEF